MKRNMKNQFALHRDPYAHELLAGLIQAKAGVAADDYALFFSTGEGRALPHFRNLPDEKDIEERSGYVLTRRGDIFMFWLGWDDILHAPALTVWERAEPAPHWIRNREYRRARELMGLPVA